MNKPIDGTLHRDVALTSTHTENYQALIVHAGDTPAELRFGSAACMESLGLAMGFIDEVVNLPIYHHEGEWVGYDEAGLENYRNSSYWRVRAKTLTYLQCLEIGKGEAPEAGATFKHHNGGEYEVLFIANQYSENDAYPATVVYRGANGKVWTKTFGNFVEKMTFVAGPARHACQSDEASAEALQATQYSKGDTYRKFDGIHVTDVWAAGIHVVSPHRKAPKEWGNRIEVFGDSEDEANNLRDLLLSLLMPHHEGEPFALGQWWMEELKTVNLSHPVTKDQYRAVAVALNLAHAVLPFVEKDKPDEGFASFRDKAYRDGVRTGMALGRIGDERRYLALVDNLNKGLRSAAWDIVAEVRKLQDNATLHHPAPVAGLPAGELPTILEKGEVVHTLDPWDEVAVCAYRVQGGDTLHYNLGPALYFGGVGVSLRQFVDLARLHNVEWDKVRDRTADLAQPIYQCREIGEGGWRDCTEEEYTRYTKYPEMDTRISQKPGTCGDAACTMDASHRCNTPKPRTE